MLLSKKKKKRLHSFWQCCFLINRDRPRIQIKGPNQAKLMSSLLVTGIVNLITVYTMWDSFQENRLLQLCQATIIIYAASQECTCFDLGTNKIQRTWIYNVYKYLVLREMHVESKWALCTIRDNHVNAGAYMYACKCEEIWVGLRGCYVL